MAFVSVAYKCQEGPIFKIMYMSFLKQYFIGLLSYWSSVHVPILEALMIVPLGGNFVRCTVGISSIDDRMPKLASKQYATVWYCPCHSWNRWCQKIAILFWAHLGYLDIRVGKNLIHRRNKDYRTTTSFHELLKDELKY